jgi:integrase
VGNRRGHGEGSITERPDGRWEVRIDLGRGIDGKRRRKSAYAATQADAVQELRALGGRVANGHVLSSGSPTLGAFLEDWYGTHQEDWRASTRRQYRHAIDTFLVPAFGPVRIDKVTPHLVQRWLLQHKAEHGPRRRIAIAHAVLRSALSEARRLQLVTVNAAELVKVPKPKARGITPLDVEQAATFVKAADAHRLGALFTVVLACGLRLGEASGLRWEDVNLETGEIQIRQQLQRIGKRLEPVPLKTEKSRRSLAS